VIGSLCQDGIASFAVQNLGGAAYAIPWQIVQNDESSAFGYWDSVLPGQFVNASAPGAPGINTLIIYAPGAQITSEVICG
jgi:hypothetical protein